MKAALDVGSNTVRMVAGEVSATNVVPFRYWRKITRLGSGYLPEVGLSADAAERTLIALEEFSKELKDFTDLSVRVVGTEAIRRARNADQFVSAVKVRSGFDLEIIDGDEEARLCANGVCSALDPLPSVVLIFDIGGGSTEFILKRRDESLFHKSYPLGVVTLAENRAGWWTVQSLIDSLIDDLSQGGWLELVLSKDCELIGTAGTVTTLAAIAMEMAHYDWRRVNNYSLSLRKIEQMAEHLVSFSTSEREMVAGMEPGRGDLIVPGMDIVIQLLKRLDKQGMRVSDFGLLEGVLLSMS